METREGMLREIAKHCDIERRLKEVPVTAQWRGMYFNGVTRAVENAGQLSALGRLAPTQHSPLRWYPARDLITHAAIGGALVASPERVHEGLTLVARYNASAFGESLLGRAMLKILSPEPFRLLQQGVAARRVSADYGQWRLERTGERTATMHFFGEYCWIESFLLGAGLGTFDAVGVRARIDTELKGPYFGRHLISW